MSIEGKQPVTAGTKVALDAGAAIRHVGNSHLIKGDVFGGIDTQLKSEMP